MNKDKIIKDLKERNDKLANQYRLRDIRCVHLEIENERLEQENKQLKEKIENLTTMTVCGDKKQIKNTAQYKLELSEQENKKEKGRVNVLEDKLREILHFCNHLHNDCRYNLNDGHIRKIRNICKKVLNEETEVKENE